MNSFVGGIEPSRGSGDPVRAWMTEWLRTNTAREAWHVEAAPFFYLASAESSDGRAPMARDEGGLTVLYYGFLARDQFAEAGVPEPTTPAEIAAALLRRYRQNGPDALVALNGRYVACAWDPATKSLHLMNDALGLKPVFLWQAQGEFYFSANLWALACHPKFRKAINPLGMVDLLMFNHQQMQRTLFADVSVLPPGGVTTFRDGALTSRQVRTLKFSDSRWTWSVGRAAEGMYERLAQSIRRRVRDGADLALPLSGGFDSRVLLGLLLERPVRLHTITQFQYGLFAEDTKYAKRMARVAGVEHRTVPLTDDATAKYREQSVALNGGMYDCQTARYLSLLDQSFDKTLPHVSAHLGGELTSRFQISDKLYTTPEEHWALALKFANGYRFTPAQVAEMLGTGVPRDLAQTAVAENRQFFFSHPTPDFHRYFNWDLLQYRRRYIAFQLLYYEQFQEVIAPFYDLDFIDFVCSLPFAAVEGQQAYCVMMRKHFPALSRIPNTNTDTPLVSSTKEVLRDYVTSQYRRFVLSPVRKMVPSRRWVGHPMAQFGYALMGDSRPVLDHILVRREKMSAYLDPVAVEKAVQRQLQGDYSNSMGLLGLATFATALDMLDDPQSAIRVWR